MFRLASEVDQILNGVTIKRKDISDRWTGIRDCWSGISDLADRDVAEYAKSVGFPEPVPRR